MECTSPYIASGRRVFPCGSCLSCRMAYARVWTHRLILESGQHEWSSFVTLTYREDRDSLETSHLRDWLKRYRKVLEPSRIRFFAIGEYGGITRRPHYHAILFGARPCMGGVRISSGGGMKCQCSSCIAVDQTWGFGFSANEMVTPARMAYVARYHVGKLTSTPPGSVEPPFVRMSRRPGIGATAAPAVASTIAKFNLLPRLNHDVPTALRHGNRFLPMGRFLRNRVRRNLSLKEECPAHVRAQLEEEMRLLCDSTEVPKIGSFPGLTSFFLSRAIGDRFRQSEANKTSVTRIRRGAL